MDKRTIANISQQKLCIAITLRHKMANEKITSPIILLHPQFGDCQTGFQLNLLLLLLKSIH
jgi:hypothetical protein